MRPFPFLPPLALPHTCRSHLQAVQQEHPRQPCSTRRGVHKTQQQATHPRSWLPHFLTMFTLTVHTCRQYRKSTRINLAHVHLLPSPPPSLPHIWHSHLQAVRRKHPRQPCSCERGAGRIKHKSMQHITLPAHRPPSLPAPYLAFTLAANTAKAPASALLV